MKKLTILILALFLVGCATSNRAPITPPTTSTTTIPLNKLYRKADFFKLDSNYGYRNWRRGRSGFKINYKGVIGLHIEVTLDLALLRAAELCLEKKYPYFGTSKISTFYKKKRHQKNLTPYVLLHVDCYNDKFDPAIYNANAVWKKINHKIASKTLQGYKSIVKRKQKS